MLASITPLGERSRNQRFGITTSAHLVGGVLGGAAVGFLVGLAGLALPAGETWRLVVFAALLAVCAAADLRIGGLAPPTHHRQVDQLWLHRYRGWAYGAGFGAQLGAGFLTIVTSAVVYATFAGAVLCGSPALGALVGATFGVVRGATPLLAARVDSPARLAVLHRRIVRHAGAASGATVTAQLVLAAAVLGFVVS